MDLEGGPEPDPGRILALEPWIVDSVTGLVRHVVDYPARDGAPRLTHAVASVAHPEWAGTGHELYAGGSDFDPTRARAAALGEALDRLATVSPRAGHRIVAAYEDVSDDAVDPARFDLYDEETRRRPGFPYASIDPSARITWVWAWSMAQRRPVMVPASRVFTSLDQATPADRVDGPNVSGCATGASPAQAALGGLLEVTERDSFMIAWAARLPVTGLAVDRDAPGRVGRYVTAFEAVDVEVRCAVITLDWGVPVVFAMARSRRPDEPTAVVSAAADPDPTVACGRALRELTANLAHVRHLLESGARPPSADPSDVRTQEQHALLYAQPQMWRHLQPWWEPERSRPVEEPREQAAGEALAGMAERIAVGGSDVLVVDLGHRELASRGMYTFKTLVPGAYPMNFDALWPHHGGTRLRSAPVEAGLLAAPVPKERLNPIPHPFP